MKELTELRVKVPSEIIEEAPDVDWNGVAVESIKLRFFELRLEKSKELRRALLRLLASKSKLTEKDSLKLGEIIKKGRFEQLKKQGLI